MSQDHEVLVRVLSLIVEKMGGHLLIPAEDLNAAPPGTLVSRMRADGAFEAYVTTQGKPS